MCFQQASLIPRIILLNSALTLEIFKMSKSVHIVGASREWAAGGHFRNKSWLVRFTYTVHREYREAAEEQQCRSWHPAYRVSEGGEEEEEGGGNQGALGCMVGGRGGQQHTRRIKTEENAKVFAAVWGDRIQLI